MAAGTLRPGIRFSPRFTDLYNEYCDSDRGRELLRLSGVSREQLDVATMTMKYFSFHTGDMSVDPNANVGNNKNPNNFSSEISKAQGKLNAFHLLWSRIAADHGDERACELIGRLWRGYIYFHDMSGHGITAPYCFAASTLQLVFQGRPYGQLYSVVPKRSDSFMSQVIEYTMDLSQEFMGAIALGDLLVNYAMMSLRDGVDPNTKEGQKKIENDYQRFIHVGNNSFRIAGQSPFLNVSIFDRSQLRELFKDYEYPWEEKAIDHIDEVMRYQEIFMGLIAKKDPSSGLPYRFPVVTVNVTTENGQVQDKNFLDLVCKYNQEGLFNVYVTDGVGKVAMCCRYLNDVKSMRDRQRADVWGNGGINIGSTRVCTVNLVRLALESSGPMEFKSNLKRAVEDAVDLLAAHRELLEEFAHSGYLKFFKPLGWINMNMLFSTIGVVGMYEALSLFGERYMLPSDLGVSTAKDILQYIDDIAKRQSERLSIPFNVEQIPAEGAAVTLARADKVFHPKSPFEIYSNQSIPLWVDVDMTTRARIDGELNRCYSGGGISHLNIGAPVTEYQHRKLIEFGIGCGLDHFALNLVFCKCENDHAFFGRVKRCPKCGGRVALQETRVVGYFVPVADWAEVRRTYEFPRRVWADVPKEFSNNEKGGNGSGHKIEDVQLSVSIEKEVPAE